jgi:hypothetical protein
MTHIPLPPLLLLLLLLLLQFATAGASCPRRAVLLLCCAGVCVQLCCQAGPVLQQVCCTQQGVGCADGCGRRLLLLVCQLLPAQQAEMARTEVMQKPNRKGAVVARWALVHLLDCGAFSAALMVKPPQPTLEMHMQEPTLPKALRCIGPA